MSHGDSITRLPAGFTATAQTDSTPFAGLADPARSLYGIQFHPEVVHTPRGRDVLRQLRARHRRGAARLDLGQLHRVDRGAASASASIAHARRDRLGRARSSARSPAASISAVAATLVHRAVGDRLTCIYVDHGLMRKRESELLRETFEANLGMRPGHGRRPRALPGAASPGVEDPEQKRRIIGDEFIRVFEEEAAQARPHRLPDPGHALPRRHRVDRPGDARRPRRSRRTTTSAACPPTCASSSSSRCATSSRTRCARSAWSSACPSRWSMRQPFPGPGLAIRIIGEVTARAAGHAPRGRLDRHRRDQGGRALPQRLAVVRHPHPGAQRGRHGRRPHLRQRRGHPRRHQRGRHDGRLGQAALRRAGHASPPASSTRSPASTASSTTSAASRPPPSSGSERPGADRARAVADGRGARRALPGLPSPGPSFARAEPLRLRGPAGRARTRGCDWA